MDGEECVSPRTLGSGWRRAAVVRRLGLQRSTHSPLCSTPVTPAAAAATDASAADGAASADAPADGDKKASILLPCP
jgi:hypothetical protein